MNSNIFIIKDNNNIDEITEYLKENTIKSKNDSLYYWLKNNDKYFILSILARKYLAILATFASIEFTFNISNNIINSFYYSLEAYFRL